jgi:hypothetical protein
MTDTPRHQRDLFERPIAAKRIPSSSEASMLELLKALLTEALSDEVVARDVSKEADDDEDHA